MNNMTETKAPEPTKEQLEAGRVKWQKVVDQLYRSLKTTPGCKATLAMISHRNNGLVEETTIRHIRAGEVQIAIFDERIAKLAREQRPKPPVSL